MRAVSLSVKVLFLLLALTLSTGAGPVDWAARAQEATWSWPDREPSLFDCAMRDKKTYQVQLEHIWKEKFIVHITQNNKVRLKFEAHPRTVFEFRGNKIVYASFNPNTSGCTVAAFDLALGKQLWQKPLKGVGDIEHSFYSNRVSLQLNGNVIEIKGWEDGGKYLEYLDIESGETLGHRKF